jgi:hypothetical protein
MVIFFLYNQQKAEGWMREFDGVLFVRISGIGRATISPMASRKLGPIRAPLERLRRFLKKDPQPPPPAEDPYAYVTAPKRPRPSNRGAAAVMDLPEE